MLCMTSVESLALLETEGGLGGISRQEDKLKIKIVAEKTGIGFRASLSGGKREKCVWSREEEVKRKGRERAKWPGISARVTLPSVGSNALAAVIPVAEGTPT